MHPAIPAGPTRYNDEPGGGPSRRAKALVAGAAIASVGVIAVNPVAAPPALYGARDAAFALSAFQNPFDVWQQTFTKSGLVAQGLSADISAASATLTGTLRNPDIQAELAGALGNVASDPLRLLSALVNFQADYGDRLSAASEGSDEALQAAIAALPTVLQNTAGFLAQGEFLEAFSEVNLWFLVEVLSDGRAENLDVLRVPGDFLESIGLDPLARILGTSWMDEYFDPGRPAGEGRTGYGPGLLSRGVVGNLGRALLAPQVTAIIQTAEILDAAREAAVAGDFETVASEVINAPAKIANAFLNGYVPKFIQDGELSPGLPAQIFPGILSPSGPVDFLFVQIPKEIAKTLAIEKPAAATDDTSHSLAKLVSAPPTALPSSSTAVTITVDAATPTLAAPALQGGATAPEKSRTTPTVLGAGAQGDESSPSETKEVTTKETEATGGATSDSTSIKRQSIRGKIAGKLNELKSRAGKPAPGKQPDNKTTDNKPDDKKPADKKATDTTSGDSE